jgi:NifB/MoaA-like Fe-S oxidoreductase
MEMGKKAALKMVVVGKYSKPIESHYAMEHIEEVKRLARRYRDEEGYTVSLKRCEVESSWSFPELEDIMEMIAS